MAAMRLKYLPGLLLLAFAIGGAVFGGLMYVDSPRHGLARFIGGVLVGGSVLVAMSGLLLLVAARSAKPRRGVRAETPHSDAKGMLGWLVGTVFGALLIYTAIHAAFVGEFPAGRKAGSLPTRFSESPGNFIISFVLIAGIGSGLLWLCLPPVLRAFAPGGESEDER